MSIRKFFGALFRVRQRVERGARVQVIFGALFQVDTLPHVGARVRVGALCQVGAHIYIRTIKVSCFFRIWLEVHWQSSYRNAFSPHYAQSHFFCEKHECVGCSVMGWL